MTMASHLILDRHNQLSFQIHPDNFIIDKQTGYEIQRVRELVRWTHKKPFNRTYKLVLISPVEKLSLEAQNTLLKTTEEPPSNTFIFLVTQNPEKVILTLRSRCAQISLDQLSRKETTHQPEINNWLGNFIFRPQETTSKDPDYPTIINAKDAFEQAAKLSKLKREPLQDYLQDWTKTLMLQNPTQNYQIVDYILKAQKYLSHNTNLQLTLEALFLNIAQLKAE